MKKKDNALAQLAIRRNADGSSDIEVKPSYSGAMKGAATGMLIGRAFGPVGIVAGATVGGVLGFIVGD